MKQAAQKQQVSDEIARQIQLLDNQGFSLLPIGGASGKAPLAKNWANKRLHMRQVLGPMNGAGSDAYGIRLEGLTVLDCDVFDSSLIDGLQSRFGTASVQVKTPRGAHLYFSSMQANRPNLKSEGLPVDVKTGGNEYVLGPLSVRGDGGRYLPLIGSLGKTALVPVKCSGNATQRPPQGHCSKVLEGRRHDYLIKRALEFAPSVETLRELKGNLEWVRQEECASPETLDAKEAESIAKWAWGCRLENRLFHGKNSTCQLNRLATDTLRKLPNFADALALYVCLIEAHGHRQEAVFKLNCAAMRRSGLHNLSDRKFLAARRALEGAGLLQQTHTHRPAKHGKGFRLLAPQRLLASTENNCEYLLPRGL